MCSEVWCTDFETHPFNTTVDLLHIWIILIVKKVDLYLERQANRISLHVLNVAVSSFFWQCSE